MTQSQDEYLDSLEKQITEWKARALTAESEVKYLKRVHEESTQALRSVVNNLNAVRG